jgi:hypothetical protein
VHLVGVVLGHALEVTPHVDPQKLEGRSVAGRASFDATLALEIREGRIECITAFMNPGLFAAFGFPSTLG